MSGTLYAGPDACAKCSSWFAKNSDSDAAEAQAICIVGRRSPAPLAVVGSRSLAFPDRGFSFVISKTQRTAGGDMGVNERGVAIGSEAAYPRFSDAEGEIPGTDIVRAALAYGESAKDAALAICRFVERPGPSGGGQNDLACSAASYIVSDSREAFLVETAGERWAWRRIRSVAAISNSLSIENDYKGVDARSRSEIEAVPEGMRKSWRNHIGSRFRTYDRHADARREAIEGILETARGSIDLTTVLSALRIHGRYGGLRYPFRRGTSVCMHGGLAGTAVTGSMAVAYHPSPDFRTRATIWITGTSYPCLSVYKPILLIAGEFTPLWTDYDYADGASRAYDYWMLQRAWIRKARAGDSSLDRAFVSRRDAIQERMARAAAKAHSGGSLENARRAVRSALCEWRRQWYRSGVRASGELE